MHARAVSRARSHREFPTPVVRFIDIAGLVEGGEGLGNQFLGEIRQVDAVAHVVRCFAAPDVAHVYAGVDPIHDVGVIETELLLADLDVLSRAIDKRRRDWQTHPRENAEERRRLELYRRNLEQGVPLATLELDAEDQRELKALGLLSGKSVLYVANVSEDGYGQGTSPEAERLRRDRAKHFKQTPRSSLGMSNAASLAQRPPGRMKLALRVS